MSVQSITAARRSWRVAAFVVLTMLAGCAPPPPVSAAAIPPLPSGKARIWFYRANELYVSLDRPYIRLNGRVAGISEPGGVFYRDVSPGSYHVTVDSYGTAPYQFVTVGVAPGQTLYVQVEVLKSWDCDGGRSTSCHPTFFTSLMQPAAGAAAVAHTPYYAGGS